MERTFDPTVFTKNRERLLCHQVGRKLFEEVVLAANDQGLLSDEHFTVDGTLIEAAASLKSFKPRDGQSPPDDGERGNPSVDFGGQRRRNATHQSTRDREARLFRKGKGKEAWLAFMAHALMENGNGLLTFFLVSEATGTAERDAVPVLVDGARALGLPPRTLGAERGYDRQNCVQELRGRGVTRHVSQNTSRRRSAIDRRTTRHAGYAVSQRIRKRVEEIFGWMKTIGGFRRTRYRGRERTVPGGDRLQPRADGEVDHAHRPAVAGHITRKRPHHQNARLPAGPADRLRSPPPASQDQEPTHGAQQTGCQRPISRRTPPRSDPTTPSSAAC